MGSHPRSVALFEADILVVRSIIAESISVKVLSSNTPARRDPRRREENNLASRHADRTLLQGARLAASAAAFIDI